MENISTALRQLLYDLRVQNVKYARDAIASITSEYLTDSNPLLASLMEHYGADRVSTTLSQIYKAIESEDWVYLADLLESICIPSLEKLAVDAPPVRIKDYLIESTSSGHNTVKSLTGEVYIHSNVDPVWEASRLADDIYDPVYRGYIIWGCGLGYFAFELGKLTDGSVPIRVYDEDDEIIKLAREYGCAEEAKQYNVEFICDPMATLFAKDLSVHPEYGLMMHQPSMRKIRNESVRNALLKYYTHDYEPVRRFDHKLKRNYYSNLALHLDGIEIIEDKIRNKEVVIVAAGPSLDDSIAFLRDSVKRSASDQNRIIIAVGTILKKLMALNLVPDYCVMFDPNPPVYKQIEGIGECHVPMILGMSTYWRVGQEYEAKKYLAMLDGMKGVDNTYNNAKYIFKTGSSVTTLGINIAMQMGASAVYLVGTDLAYANGHSHASGTAYQLKKSEKEMLEVEAVDGETVYTTPTLDEVRRWIEDEIKRYPDIPVYNLSGKGALIQGAINISGHPS